MQKPKAVTATSRCVIEFPLRCFVPPASLRLATINASVCIVVTTWASPIRQRLSAGQSMS